MAKKMRLLRLLKLGASAAIALGFVAGLGPRQWTLVWAQLPTPNPLIAPVPAPAAPAQLPAPITTAVLPSLAPMPTPPAATPAPATRSFTCSCYGPATHTNWMGQVAAPTYFAARQAALKACFAYNKLRSPESPFLNPNLFGPNQFSPEGPIAPILPGMLPFGLANPEIATMPGTLNFSTQTQMENCSTCACD